MEMKLITAELERQHKVVLAMKGLPEAQHAQILAARVHGHLSRQHGIKNVDWDTINQAAADHLAAQENDERKD